MPIYDYHCQCGHREEDRYYARWQQAPVRIQCSACLGKAKKVIGTKNFIHPSISTLYGRPEPALGGDCFESYDHKRKLLNKLGAIEASDRIQGAKLYQDQVRSPKPRPNERLRWGDEPVSAKE